MAESQQKFTFRVDLSFDEPTRREIADDVLKFILRRTETGKDKNNKKFKKYSEAYSESLDFKIAGKSRSHVDLQLSGDMLTDLRVLNTKVIGFITIGFDPGTDENDKAAWQRNNLQPGFPKRDFLGIAQVDLQRILLRYRARTLVLATQEQEIKEKVKEEAERIVASFVFNE